MTTASPPRPILDVLRQALRVLDQEIGPADTARLFTHIRSCSGDYTEERRAIYGGMTPEEIWAEVERYSRDHKPTEMESK